MTMSIVTGSQEYTYVNICEIVHITHVQFSECQLYYHNTIQKENECCSYKQATSGLGET